MDLASALTLAFKNKLKVKRTDYSNDKYFTVEAVGPKYLVCYTKKKTIAKFSIDSIMAQDWETFR